MSIAIMQPYIFPYVGFFQLIHASDTFVFYDDVNFINRGWINRNRILVNGKEFLFTVPCKDASQNKLIKDIEVTNDLKAIQKILSTVQMAYKKAPFFSKVFPVIQEVFSFDEGITISNLAINSIYAVCKYLNLASDFKLSSSAYSNQQLKKEERLIDICLLEQNYTYVNAEGGKVLYDKKDFHEKGIDLLFLNAKYQPYKQFNNEFIAGLSIIDILMFNDIDEINKDIIPLYILE